jgi:hypothetical protein
LVRQELWSCFRDRSFLSASERLHIVTYFNFVVKYVLELSALVYHLVHICYVHAHVCEQVDNILNIYSLFMAKPQDLEIIM